MVQEARMLCGTAVCGPQQFLMGYCPAMKQTEIFCGFGYDSSLETSIACLCCRYLPAAAPKFYLSCEMSLHRAQGNLWVCALWLVGGSACRPQLAASSSGQTFPFCFPGSWTGCPKSMQAAARDPGWLQGAPMAMAWQRVPISAVLLARGWHQSGTG